MIDVNINIGDVLVMKKLHPCGNNKFLVKRVGMDFKLQCLKCNHVIMIPRSKAEKFTSRILEP